MDQHQMIGMPIEDAALIAYAPYALLALCALLMLGLAWWLSRGE